MRLLGRFSPLVVAFIVAFSTLPELAQALPPASPAVGGGAALVQRYVEIVNAGDLAALDEIVSPDFTQPAVGLAALFGGGQTGPDLLRQEIAGLRAAFPDLRYELNAVTTEGSVVVAALTLTGTHRGPYAAGLGVVPPSGRRVAVPVTESLRVVDGRIAERAVVMDRLALASQAAIPGPPDAPLAPVPSEEVAAFPAAFEHAMESIAIAPDGRTFVTNFTGEIREIAPDGTWSVFSRLPGVGTVAVDAAGNVYATSNMPDSATKGIWRFAPNGAGERLAPLPPEAAPNGITLGPDGAVYAADSLLGRVWRVPVDGNVATVWVESDLLAPRPFLATFPGANGAKFFGGALYVSNPDRATFVRVPVLPTGEAGSPEVWASGVSVDDFAFDVRGNAYGTTHPFNSVVRVAPDGTLTVLATPAEGVVGPTAAVFGTRPGEETSLFVVTDGGWAAPLLGPNQLLGGDLGPNPHPTVVKLDVGVAGLPLP